METPLVGWALDPTLPETLTDQLYAAFRRRIGSAGLEIGMQVPPSRKLAQDLSISRTTVTRVYDQLLSEGVLVSRPGAGLFVASGAHVEWGGAAYKTERHMSQQTAQTELKRLVLSPAAPDDQLFPHREWGRHIARIARTNPQAFTAEADPKGDADLRREVCRFLAEWRGIQAEPEDVIITAGSIEALALCLRAIQPNHVAVEDPSYPPLVRLIQAQTPRGGEPRLTALEMSAEGACLPATRQDMVVLTPSAQFPMGGVMSPGRRQQYLAWAQAHDAVIVEDDYDSEFRYAGRPIPALASLDAQQNVIYVGSFSKVMSRSLRLGYMVMPSRLQGPLRRLIQSGTQVSRMPQPALASFMAAGGFYRHIRRVRRIYRDRRALVMEGLRDIFGPTAVQDHKTGMQVVAHLPTDVCDRVMVDRAQAAGLGVRALSSYAVKRTDLNGLIVGFAADEVEEIRTGLSVLLRIYTEYRG